MRSVFILIDRKDREKVIHFLNKYCNDTFVAMDHEQWNVRKDGDAIFYIYETSAEELFSEMEEKTYFDKLDGEHKRYACWQIDISGRHDGTAEIKQLLGALFSELSGFVVDDYTDYFWTFSEIDNDTRVEGHTFFDHVGWYYSRHET